MISNIFPNITGIPDFFDCPKLGTMPFMQRPVNGTINQQLYENLQYLNSVNFKEVPDLFFFPDGAVNFYEANPTNLSYILQINDIISTDYHR